MLGQYAIGALAQNKAQDPRVKALAKTVTANATSANETLKKLANSHGIAPATQADDSGFLPVLYAYGEIGSSFDQAFAGQIGIDASIAADTYADYAAHGSNPELRSFAKEQAATLKEIAAQAQRLH